MHTYGCNLNENLVTTTTTTTTIYSAKHAWKGGGEE
jgi:hypothetical protein